MSGHAIGKVGLAPKTQNADFNRAWGSLHLFSLPTSARVDTGIERGDLVIAPIISHDRPSFIMHAKNPQGRD